MFTRYVATKDLFQALIRAKRSFRTDEVNEMVDVGEQEELAPDTYRDDVRFEDG